MQAKRHNWVPDPANPGSEFHRVVTETFVYGGPGGRLSLKHLRATDPDSAAAASFTQSFEYDLLGVLAAETYPVCVSPRCELYGPPRTVSYEHSEGVLTAVPGWVNSISYHPNGLVSQIQHFTGMIDTLGNDPNAMRRPGSISFAGARSSLSLGSYSYDGAGNLKSIGTDLFAYDGVSRLTEANLQSVTSSQSYTFDSFGNLTSITTTQPDASGQPLVTPRSIGVSAATNRLTASPYDAAGNVTSLFTLTSLAYDPFNRVTHLTGTGVNKSFLYTAADMRVGVIDHQAQTEDWTLRGLHDKVVRSYRKTPNGWQWQQDWAYRDGVLAGSSEHEKWRQYHLDHLGSPRLVTGPASEKIAEYHPFPFGEMAAESGVGVDEGEGLFRYTGHERDTNCDGCDPPGLDDLDYMLARYFSPYLGRFLSPDPVNLHLQRSMQGTSYTYALNNPLKLIDTDGREARLGLQPGRGLAAARLSVPAALRGSIRMGRNSAGNAIVVVDNSVRSESLNYNNLRKVVNSPGVVEINVGDRFSFTSLGQEIVTTSLSENSLKGVTLPTSATGGPEAGAFSLTPGVTQIYIQENLSDRELAPVVAAEIAGHALPGLLGEGAAVTDRDVHENREGPAKEEAKRNLLEDERQE